MGPCDGGCGVWSCAHTVSYASSLLFSFSLNSLLRVSISYTYCSLPLPQELGVSFLLPPSSLNLNIFLNYLTIHSSCKIILSHLAPLPQRRAPNHGSGSEFRSILPQTRHTRYTSHGSSDSDRTLGQTTKYIIYHGRSIGCSTTQDAQPQLPDQDTQLRCVGCRFRDL